jgi:cytochrome c-type biogenesis protein CcmF
MIPELGNFALMLALGLALLQAALPLIGAASHNATWMALGRPLSAGLFVFLLLGFGCLAYAFLHDDFSVAYVARNSNTALPVYYKFAAVWGAHEGSLLLWVLILASWGYAVSLFSQRLPLDIVARVLAVMGLITAGFLVFLLFTSNPFERLLLNTPREGTDLNPLLQDFGLTVHPPFLYMGYVGFSVAFAFAIAALLTGKLDAAWARWTRPWTNAAWAFLTIGIMLGSWWSYYELGWGGWWFWDPVENVSFMPWLVGTALIHSLAVTEKRGVFKSWTVLLALAAFSLSLLGAFIVRSGVITSVHAFAVDPERGMVLLALLLLIIGSSLLLYALRAPVVRGTATYGANSREVFLLLNNLLLVVSMATILLGTLFPLIHEAIYGEANRVSVGPPYFNAVFVPLMAILAFLLGASTFARWKKTSFAHLRQNLSLVLLASVVLGVAVPLVVTGGVNPAIMLALALALWIVFGIAKDLWDKTAHRSPRLPALLGLGRSYFGMQLAHLGVAVLICGVCFTSHYSIEQDVRMSPGDALDVSGFTFRFDGVEEVPGPNYTAVRGTISVSRGGESYLTMHPEKRTYHARGDVQTEADIDVGFFRDLFTALGDPRGDEAWVVRIHFKPFVFWIWLGALLMAGGGVLAVLDKRYRHRAIPATRSETAADAGAVGTAGVIPS